MDKIKKVFINKLIFEKYRITKRIENGSYSSVFYAQNIINKKIVAAKIQDINSNIDNLEKEAYYLLKLKGIGIPKIYSYGLSGRYKILVEELLGKNLEIIFRESLKKDKNLRLKDMLMVGIQVLDRIKFIHSHNIVHSDIKTNNFLLGNPDNSIIYLIDFGFAKKYRSSRTGNHIQFSFKKYFRGNLQFSSINAMRGIEQTRRDDIISIGYMLIYLYTQYLPWTKLKSKDTYALGQKILKKKNTTSIEVLCKDVPKEMEEFMRYVLSLTFEEEPNYNYLKKLLEIMLNKINKINDLNFTWIKKSDILSKKRIYSKIHTGRKISPFLKIIKNMHSKNKSEEKNYNKSIKDYFKKDTKENDKNNLNCKSLTPVKNNNNNNMNIIKYDLKNNNTNNNINKKNKEIKNIFGFFKKGNEITNNVIKNSFIHNNLYINDYTNNNCITIPNEKKNKDFITNSFPGKKIEKNENIITNWINKINKNNINKKSFDKDNNDLEVEMNFLMYNRNKRHNFSFI